MTNKFYIVKRKKISEHIVEFYYYKSTYLTINKIYNDSLCESNQDIMDTNLGLLQYFIFKVVFNISENKYYIYSLMDYLYGKCYLIDRDIFCYVTNFKNSESIELVCKVNYIETKGLNVKFKNMIMIKGIPLLGLLGWKNNMNPKLITYFFKNKDFLKTLHSLFSYSFLNYHTFPKILRITNYFGNDIINFKFHNKNLLDSGEKWNDDCPICLENVLESDDLYCKLSCTHVFHCSCLEEYCYKIKSNNESDLFDHFCNSIKCPCCNSEIDLIKKNINVDILKTKTPNFDEENNKLSLDFKPINGGLESKKNIHLRNVFGEDVFKMLKIKDDYFSIETKNDLSNESIQYIVVLAAINLTT